MSAVDRIPDNVTCGDSPFATPPGKGFETAIDAANANLKVEGDTIDTGRYVITGSNDYDPPGENNQADDGYVIITDKQTGTSVEIFGDPHVHTSDGMRAEFKTSDFVINLADGTVITFKPTDVENGAAYIDKMMVTKNGQSVVETGFYDKNGSADVETSDIQDTDDVTDFDDPNTEEPTVVYSARSDGSLGSLISSTGVELSDKDKEFSLDLPVDKQGSDNEGPGKAGDGPGKTPIAADAPDRAPGDDFTPEIPFDEDGPAPVVPPPANAGAPAPVVPTPANGGAPAPGNTGNAGVGAPATAEQPPNSINAADYGVKGDGKTDDTAALQRAIDAAKAAGKTLYIPAGTYIYSGVLNVDSVNITGAGAQTVLRSTNPDQSAIRLTGEAPSISNLQVEVSAPNRSSLPNASMILVQDANGAKVFNVTVLGASANGIRLDNSTNAEITGNLVQGTNADGIALMNGSSYNTVSQNQVYQAGDDSYSDNSYIGDKKQDVGNTFRNNLSLDNAYGRGFVFAGSTGAIVEGNVVDGTPGNGIFAGVDNNSGTLPGGDNTIRNNTIIGAADTPLVANGSTVENNRIGDEQGARDKLGFVPATDLVDRYQIASQYKPGTGNGSNNSSGIRT